MSLIYWWPLTEDLTDKIQGKTFEKNDYWDIIESGKIGKCASPDYGTLNTSNSSVTKPTQMRVKNITIPETFSLAIWVKNNQTGNPFTFCPIQFSNGDPYLQGAANKGWDFSHNTWRLVYNDGATFYGGRNSGSGSQSSWGTNLDTPLNEWYHIAFTVNRATNKTELFINGISKGIRDIPAGLGSFGGTCELRFNWVQGWLLNGAFNDLRIYNHVLSKAEIQELKKALVVHYTFDDTLIPQTTNLMRTDLHNKHVAGYVADAGAFAIANDQPGSYTLSAWMTRYPDDQTPSPYFTLRALGDKDAVLTYSYTHIATDGINIRDTADGQPHFFSVTINAPAGVKYLQGWLLDRDEYKNQYRNIKVENVQLEAGSIATPYTPSSRDGMLYNETGLAQHDEETLTNIHLSTNAAVGQYSLDCNNTQIKNKSDSRYQDNYTISTWVYPRESYTGGCIVIGGYYLKLNENGTISTYCYGRKNSKGEQNEGYFTSSTSLNLVKFNQWNHIAITWFPVGCDGYINGKKVLTVGDCLTWNENSMFNHDKKYIGMETYGNGTQGNPFNGLIDDIRIYHTCLNDDEIKELYNCGGRISNLGDALTGSFIEGESATKVNKNHTITTKELYEQILPDGYQQLEYIENKDTAYIDTGIEAKANITKLETHHQRTKNDSTQILFGSYDGVHPNYFYQKESTTTYCRTNWRAVALHNEDATLDINKDIYGTLTIQNNVITFETNGHIVSSSSLGANTSSSTQKYYLFGYNNQGTYESSYAYHCKLYAFKIWVDNNLVRDFIPARNSSGVIGLYDIINNQFYTNANSSSDGFIAGPTITTGQASMLRKGGLTAREIIEI